MSYKQLHNDTYSFLIRNNDYGNPITINDEEQINGNYVEETTTTASEMSISTSRM